MAKSSFPLSTSYRTIDEVAQHLSMSERTIRSYVEKGVISRPVRMSGRAYYSDLHVRQLEKIQLQLDEGKTLAEIALNRRLRSKGLPEAASNLQTVTVRLIPVAPGITIQVAMDLDSFQKRVLKKLMEVRRSVQDELTSQALPARKRTRGSLPKKRSGSPRNKARV